MESVVFRRKLALRRDSHSNSISQRTPTSGIARCLFGAPDPKLAIDMVREVELKSALSFGKRFNFDIIQGEPFLSSAKKMKTDPEASDEENVEMDDLEGGGGGGSYVWTDRFEEDYMTKCNSVHTCESDEVGPSRVTVSLLFAPIIASQPISSSSLSSSSSLHVPTSPVDSSSATIKKSDESPLPEPQQPQSTTSSFSAKKKSYKKSLLKNKCQNKPALQRNNRQNTLFLHNQKSTKRTSPLQQVITKFTYANRVLKQAIRKTTTSMTKNSNPRCVLESP